MELKVWVGGVARVLCGLSLDTSCQEVVIALAQAMGQTGRYILVQKLRGCERKLVAGDCPLRSLAQMGPLAKEVQFILRRTGPRLRDESPASPHTDPEPPTRRKPRKALSFHLGPSSLPSQTRTKVGSPRASPELRASPPPSLAPPLPPLAPPLARLLAPPSKDDIFSQVLKQQELLQQIEAQLRGLEREEETLEKPVTPAQGLAQGLQEERLLEEQLQVELEREQNLLQQLKHLCFCLDDSSSQVLQLQSDVEDLGRDLQHEAWQQASWLGSAQPTDPLDLRAELHLRQVQGEELKAMMTEAERETQAVEEHVQEKNQELDELNKELRKYYLKDFIQETGNSPTPDHSHTSQPDHTHPSQPPHTSPRPPDQIHSTLITTPHPGHAPLPYLCSAGILDENQSVFVIMC